MTPPIPLFLEIATNRWRLGSGDWVLFARRYEAMVLLWLQHHALEPLSLAQLQDLLRQHGQKTRFNRAQIQRLVDAINQAGTAAMALMPANPADGAYLWRLRHPPRCKTTGPWLLACAAQVHIQTAPSSDVGVLAAQPPTASSLPPAITDDAANWHALVRWLNALLDADVQLHHGDLQGASTTLTQLWVATRADRALSVCAVLLVLVRLVKVQTRLSAYRDARESLADLQARLGAAPWPALWAEVAQQLQRRLTYCQRASNLAEAEITALLVPAGPATTPAPGLCAPERLSLDGLLLRRRAALSASEPQRRVATQAAMHHLQAALLLALLHEHHQQAQACAYNLSLVAEAEGLTHAHMQLLAYVERCCRLLHVGQDSQWALVSLAKQLLLGQRQGPALQESLALADLPPAHLPEFWMQLVQRAQKTQNPREIGYALKLAHTWFADRGDHSTAQQLLTQFNSLCQQHSGLRSLVAQAGL